MATTYFNHSRNQSNEKTTYSKTGGMKYTFVVEIETSRGNYRDVENLSASGLNLINTSAVYDGSVGGPEYVTGVLKGDMGVEQLERLCDALNQTNHEVNRRCGIHIHIGGANFNRAFQAMAIRLAYQIQDQVYEMLPESRQNNTYCKKIDKSFRNINFKNANKKLAEYLFRGESSYDKDGNYSHADWRKGFSKKLNKKNRLGRYPNTRYRWVNLVRCGTASNGETLEFRCHGGSLNFGKIYNWLMICMAIVRFIENNQARIMKKGVTLLEILNEAFTPAERERLVQYINERRKNFGHKEMRKHLYYKRSVTFADVFSGTKQSITFANSLKK